ncbi:MAG TPA: hypothetical protein VFC04_02515 [Actinomycetota bacterium]|nr:hypothetical protein [Actinomycetota bacterium]
MLRKVAAGIGSILLIPVLVLAAAVGSLEGDASGAPVAVGVFCTPTPTGSQAPPGTQPASPAGGGSRACQAGELEAMPRVLCEPTPTVSALPETSAAASAEPGSHRCQAGELEAMVLSNPRIHLGSLAVGDVAEGRVDPRVLQVLLLLAERHSLGSVGPLISGHSYFVAGTTTPSNHAFGRAVDVSVIDGRAVSIFNPAARDAMQMVLSFPPPLLPDELGGPWLLPHPSAVAVFTRDHGDHLHIGWDR